MRGERRPKKVALRSLPTLVIIVCRMLRLWPRSAQAAGAEAIGAMAPTFFKPADAGALVDWFARITEPAREVPFYFYDIPSMTGVNINTKEFVHLVTERVPGFAGVKYTNTDREAAAGDFGFGKSFAGYVVGM